GCGKSSETIGRIPEGRQPLRQTAHRSTGDETGRRHTAYARGQISALLPPHALLEDCSVCISPGARHRWIGRGYPLALSLSPGTSPFSGSLWKSGLHHALPSHLLSTPRFRSNWGDTAA